MKQLGCSTWDQVTEEYPTRSSYKALHEYFIAFREWVSHATYVGVIFNHTLDVFYLFANILFVNRNQVVERKEQI